VEGKILPDPFRVLVVESSPADAYLIAEALKQAGMPDNLTTLHDSHEALEYLEKGRPADLVILDLNLAPFDGFQLLKRIREHPELNDLPVVVMSGSEDRRDVKKAYQLRANCYIVKPNNLDLFLRSMRIWYEFWSSVVRLPRN
jgi:two-component system, chemotaxis family, response regulator Rcp1